MLLIFAQTFALICHAEIGTCILVLYAGICKFLTEFTIEIKHHLQHLRNGIIVERDGDTRSLEKFNETIQFHADVKELSEIFCLPHYISALLV